MAAFGSDEYLILMAVLFGLGLLELARRRIVRFRTHHRVPHYKLRAAGHLLGDVPTATRRGSAVATTSVEPQPAPGSALQPSLPGAGPELRTAASPLAEDVGGGPGYSSRSESAPPDPAPIGVAPGGDQGAVGGGGAPPPPPPPPPPPA